MFLIDAAFLVIKNIRLLIKYYWFFIKIALKNYKKISCHTTKKDAMKILCSMIISFVIVFML